MQTNPQILLVIEGTYPWYRGGVSEWVHQYIRAFDEVQFGILQIATDEYRDSSIDDATYAMPDHVSSFIRIPPPAMKGDWDTDAKAWFQSHSDQLSETAGRAECVHVTNTGFAGWLGMKLAATHDKPLVLTEHALYWEEVKMGAVALECGYKIPQHEQGKAYVSDLFKNIARQVYRTSDEIISVSESNIPRQREVGAKSVRYIPNGVEASWIREEKSRTQPLTLGWIGRCAEMKNPLKFLEVACQLQAPAKCLMMLCDAAEPGLKKQVITEAEQLDNIILVWNRPAIEHIDRMDALCITSHNESQPLVLFEALSRKVLPFGWSTGDVTSKYGVVAAQGTPVEEMASSITELWNSPEKWRQELEKRFQQIKNHHTWQGVFSQYKSVLQPYLTPSLNPSF